MKTEEIKIEEIKIGETYNVRVKVHRMASAGLVCHACDKDGHYLSKHPNFFTEDEVEAFSPVTPAPKHSEPAPKYDPCRLFKDGDKVTPRLVNGRDFNSVAEDYRGKILTVTRDEEKYDNVFVEYGGDEFTIDPAYLELVTPVEELERYVVEPSDVAYFIVDKKHERGEQNVVMYMFAFHPHAKAAAEAECARLNEEYRKKQS